MIKCCSHETFLHFGLQGSRLNICYCHQDLHYWPLHSPSQGELLSNQHAHLLVTTDFYSGCDYPIVETAEIKLARFSVINFQG